jgi:hypothetical protein
MQAQQFQQMVKDLLQGMGPAQLVAWAVEDTAGQVEQVVLRMVLAHNQQTLVLVVVEVVEPELSSL